MVRGAEPGRREGAEAEERAMAERDLPGEPDQHVEAERGDAVDADQDELAQQVVAREQRYDQQEGDTEARRDGRAARAEQRHVRAIAGAEVAARPWIRHERHDLAPSRHSRSIFSVPNRP